MPKQDDSITLPWSWGETPHDQEALDPEEDVDAAEPTTLPRLPAPREAEPDGRCTADSVALQALQVIHSPGVSARQLDQATSRVMDAYGGLLKRLAKGILNGNDEDAEEVLTDTTMQFLRHCPTDCVAPDAWLIVVARRLAISRLVRQQCPTRRPAQGFAPVGAPGDPGALDELAADPETHDPLAIMLQREQHQALHDSMPSVARSSTARAQTLGLLLAGHSIGEIAARLAVSEGAIRDRLYRVRKLLSSLMKDRQS